MISPMSFAARKLALLMLLPLFPLLTHCGNKNAPETNVVTGPFDNRGNYMEDWVDQPDKWYKPNSAGDKKKSAPLFAKKETPPVRETVTFVPTPVRSADTTPSRPETTDAKVTPKPKPKLVSKPKPKPKPKPVVVRHTVRKGDTLSGLASKYGTSTSKIRSANNLSGSMIRLGQTLTIPK